MSPLACCADCPDTFDCIEEGCRRAKAGYRPPFQWPQTSPLAQPLREEAARLLKVCHERRHARVNGTGPYCVGNPDADIYLALEEFFESLLKKEGHSAAFPSRTREAARSQAAPERGEPLDVVVDQT